MLFNDELQKKAGKFVEAKANETKFNVFQKKVLFGAVIVLIIVLVVVIIITIKDAAPGVSNFMKYLR